MNQQNPRGALSSPTLRIGRSGLSCPDYLVEGKRLPLAVGDLVEMSSDEYGPSVFAVTDIRGGQYFSHSGRCVDYERVELMKVNVAAGGGEADGD